MATKRKPRKRVTKLTKAEANRVAESLQRDADCENALTVTADYARDAADELCGHSASDLGALIGDDLAAELAAWIAKYAVPPLRECENCGNYERTLYDDEEYGEVCVECKSDIDWDRGCAKGGG